MKLFGTSGIRGSAQSFFTDDFCIRVGYVYGQWLKTKHKSGSVAVAMDPRESSPRIKSRVMNGLAAAGFEILDEGVIPTPALTYFVQKSGFVAGGVMVTGSHITADLNGVKLLTTSGEVSKLEEKEIEKLFDSASSYKILKVEPIVKNESQGLENYIEMLKGLASTPYPKWKVVVDTTNGAQTEVVRRLFSDLKINYLPFGEFDVQSPHFVPCDTDVPETFANLARQVLLEKADFGIAFDVDGDRVVFIDETGKFIPGDYSCSLIAAHHPSKSVVTPVSSSSVIDHLGKRVFRTPVGSTYVAAKMQEVGSTFGFESNGGSILSDISWGRDGGSTAIKFLNILKATKSSVSQAIATLPQFALTKLKTDCPLNLYPEVYAEVKQKYGQKQVDETDGLKVFFNLDDWVLFRGSGNAPEFRVFAQSKDAKLAQKLGHEGIELVKKITLHAGKSPESFNTPADSLGILDSIKAFPDQIQQVLLEMPLQHIPSQCSVVDNVVVSGMGGSALGARILASLERQVLRVPLLISTEYHLPSFVNERSLVVLSSYSGNTEETLVSLQEARAKNAQLFVLAGGGELADLALLHNLPHYIFKPKFNFSGQPRIGLGYNIMGLFSLLSRCQLITPSSGLSELPKFLRQVQAESQVKAKEIALAISGKIPVLLAAEHLKGVAHDFKNQLNENAKHFAVYFDLPEADHHLLEGLSFPKTNPQNLVGVFLTSKLYQLPVQKRFNLTKQVFAKQQLPTLTITPYGKTPLEEAMSLIQLFALVSFELSLNHGIDPGPIPWVDYFKEEMK